MSESASLLPLREALEGLIAKWREEGARIDTFHATMGTGWKVCADNLRLTLLDSTVSPSLEGRWHPIETHPREPGTRFLVASHEGVREAVTDDPLWGRFSTLLVGPYIGWQPLPPAPTTKETP